MTGVKVKRAYADLGYRGHAIADKDIYISKTRGIASPTIKRELKRRSAIEPIIGSRPTSQASSTPCRAVVNWRRFRCGNPTC